MATLSTVCDLNTLDIDKKQLSYERILANDDKFLDRMRTMMKDYAQACAQSKITPSQKHAYKEKFENLRANLYDPVLKEYSFDFMEKLYLQECLAEKIIITLYLTYRVRFYGKMEPQT